MSTPTNIHSPEPACLLCAKCGPACPICPEDEFYAFVDRMKAANQRRLDAWVAWAYPKEKASDFMANTAV